MPNDDDTVTTAEAATTLDRDVRSIRRLIETGALRPIKKLPGRTGAYLFLRSDVERIAAERAS